MRTVEILSYRNDHDAAITRIGVLEHELAAARDKAARDERVTAMLEREIAELRRHRDPPLPRLPIADVPPDPPRIPAPGPLATRGPPVSAWLLLLVGVIFTLVTVGAVRLVTTAADPSPRCVTEACAPERR